MHIIALVLLYLVIGLLLAIRLIKTGKLTVSNNPEAAVIGTILFWLPIGIIFSIYVIIVYIFKAPGAFARVLIRNFSKSAYAAKRFY
ncbi:hypothetical protein [Yersinia phage MHG19]|nr:hypothetical protein [Yersinia phage MHG19]